MRPPTTIISAQRVLGGRAVFSAVGARAERVGLANAASYSELKVYSCSTLSSLDNRGGAIHVVLSKESNALKTMHNAHDTVEQ